MMIYKLDDYSKDAELRERENKKLKVGTKVNAYFQGEWRKGKIHNSSFRKFYEVRLNESFIYYGKITHIVVVHKMNVTERKE